MLALFDFYFYFGLLAMVWILAGVYPEPTEWARMTVVGERILEIASPPDSAFASSGWSRNDNWGWDC